MNGERVVMRPKRMGETLQSKCAKQKQEIARLTREVEQLRADKSNLTFDMNKLRKENEQLRGLT